MMASFAGELEIDRKLVEKGAKINRAGWTPLHYACSTGQLKIAEYLIANGANVNSLSPSHTTPLMMAVNSGNELLIKLLLDKGADLRLRNTAGFSAIDVATLFDKETIRDGLSSRWLKLYKEPYPGGPSKTSL
jgi:ankyrin repeat protein